MAEPRGIRVGDADREAVAASLREHFAHGRLTFDEFQERLDATFAAKTDLDLARITTDLPGLPGPVPSRASSASQKEQYCGNGYGPGGRRAPSAATVLLLWTLVVFFVIPGMFLSRFLLPAPILLIILFIAIGRRIWRRAGLDLCAARAANAVAGSRA